MRKLLGTVLLLGGLCSMGPLTMAPQANAAPRKVIVMHHHHYIVHHHHYLMRRGRR